VILAHLLLIGLGIAAVWIGFRIAEEVYKIALISTGAIAFAWGFAASPAELQFALEALSLGGIVRWQSRS
jgi:TRAP-type C4-dicarboxylate transport system permease small subunit